VTAIIRHTNYVVDKTKFDSCSFRSEKEIEYVSGTCCQKRKLTGFKCFKLNINKLNPLTCTNCNLYENKENIKNE